MNEQIEKLAELSGFKQDMLNIGIWYSPEVQKFAERFAESIVRECLSYAKDGDIDFMKFMIRQHFGVEE